MPAYFTGFTLGLSLIVAIGAQNAFVLRQGLRNQHVFAVALTCALSDALLIVLGVAGFRQLLAQAPWLDPLMRYGGAAFLLCYGAKSMLSALRGSQSLVAAGASPATRRQVLAVCLALTWLNPHVYLDTLLLIGSSATRFPGQEWLFACGAVSASLAFFFALGFAARLLRPLVAKPGVWRFLEAAMGLVMWLIALRLLVGI